MMNFVHWITLCTFSKSLLFVFMFKHRRASRRSWKNVLTVLESRAICESVGTLVHSKHSLWKRKLYPQWTSVIFKCEISSLGSETEVL